MNSITKPSFSTCYYIREFLQEHADELKGIMSPKSGFCPNSEAELKQLLESILYLEDNLEQLLARLYIEETEITFRVQQLEDLVQRHRSLLEKKILHSEELIAVKQQIFWILGFKLVVVKIENLVRALNQLSQFSVKYLGTVLTCNNWQSTRPNFDWLDNFQIHRSAGIKFSGSNTESVSFPQLQRIQEWVTAFINRSSQIIRDFATIIEQERIGELPEGILLTRVNFYSSWLNNKTKLPI